MKVKTGFLVVQDTFKGTLTELGYSLRAGSISPSEVNLVGLVKSFLSFFNNYVDDLSLATQALPQLAHVVELKVRLLLPKPPKIEDDEISVMEETLEVSLELEALEGAIEFLRNQREQRRLVLPARAESPKYDRPRPPTDTSARKLAALVSRFRVGSYFEVAVERFSVADAVKKLIRWLLRKQNGTFRELAEGCAWQKVGILFAGLLELVKDGRVLASQAEVYGAIQVEANELGQRKVA